jgi:hypothetical protein
MISNYDTVGTMFLGVFPLNLCILDLGNGPGAASVLVLSDTVIHHHAKTSVEDEEKVCSSWLMDLDRRCEMA